MQRLSFLLTFVLLFSCDAPSASSTETGKNYRVRPGESLFSISERAYGSGLEWPRIWEANPWLDPNRLQSGETIFIPQKGDTWGDPPTPKAAIAKNLPNAKKKKSSSAKNAKTRQSANPGAKNSKTKKKKKKSDGYKLPGSKVFHNFATTVSKKTLFGFPLEQTVLMLFCALMVHAIVQTIFVWLAANLTFVKEASMKKATKAVFKTELLLFCTVVTFATATVVLLYMGSSPGETKSAQLFPTLEKHLRSPTGLATGGGLAFLLYGILCVRFIPTAFGLHRGRSIPLIFLAVLLPHIAAALLVGHRLGWL
jgi:hypothetical protein